MRIRCSYSPRQLVTIRDFAKDKMVVHSGPFGVGKTKALVEAFALYCMELQRLGTTGLTFVLAGKTQQTVKRNMCNVLSKQFGKDFRYFKGNKDGLDRDAILFGQNIYIIGFNDASSREKFQGITDIMGILHDECTLCTKEQFDYAHGRLRGEVNVEEEGVEEEEGEFIELDDNSNLDLNSIKIPKGTVPMWYVGSCNPDVPTHFIKQYIDEGIITNIKWFRKDAIWKGAKEYYERLKRQYKNNPAFYNRYLKGEWTSADRMVYCMFQPKTHILNSNEVEVNYKQFKRTFISVDYGGDHPTAILLISVNYQGVYIVSKNWKLRNTAPSDIVQKIAEIVDYIISCGVVCSNIYVDPSAKGLKDEMIKRGLEYTNALNNHLDGIGCIQTKLSTNSLFILDSCLELIEEIYSYRYKDNTTGKDEVVKVGDDFVDSMRYGVYTDSVISR